jgi:hypothetical protein
MIQNTTAFAVKVILSTSLSMPSWNVLSTTRSKEIPSHSQILRLGRGMDFVDGPMPSLFDGSEVQSNYKPLYVWRSDVYHEITKRAGTHTPHVILLCSFLKYDKLLIDGLLSVLMINLRMKFSQMMIGLIWKR